MKSLLSKVKKILIILISMLVFTTIDADNLIWVHNVYTNEDNNTLRIQSYSSGGTCFYDTISVNQAIELYNLLYCIYDDTEKFEKIYNIIIGAIDTTFVHYVTETNDFTIYYNKKEDYIFVSLNNVKRRPIYFNNNLDFKQFLYLLKVKTNTLIMQEPKDFRQKLKDLI